MHENETTINPRAMTSFDDVWSKPSPIRVRACPRAKLSKSFVNFITTG